MSYCYCVPRRDMTAATREDARRYRPGDAHPMAATVPWLSGYVMGTRGRWVQEYQRTAGIRAWESRRTRMAAEAAEVQHCDHPEVQAPQPEVTTTTAVEPMVIEGTVPETTTKTPTPVALTV